MEPEHDPDRRVLAFAAEHPLILAPHVAVLLDSTPIAAGRRLARLARSRHLRSDDRLTGHRAHQIDRRGLAAIDSPLPRPRSAALANHDHDVGLAWLWLAARRGAFGPVSELLSERRMRSEDGRPRSPALGPEPHGVRLGGVGPRGGERRHYPDLVVITAAGRRVAIELELTLKGRRRREEILSGYAFDPRFDAVLYLVDRPEAGRAIARSARRAGVGHLVSVQRIAFGPGSGAITPGRAGARVAARRRRTPGRELGR